MTMAEPIIMSKIDEQLAPFEPNSCTLASD